MGNKSPLIHLKTKKNNLAHQHAENASSNKYSVKSKGENVKEAQSNWLPLLSVPKVNLPLKGELLWALASFTASRQLRGVKD